MSLLRWVLTNDNNTRWVFTIMAGVHVLYAKDNQLIIVNLTDTKNKIINLLGPFAKKYFFRV